MNNPSYTYWFKDFKFVHYIQEATVQEATKQVWNIYGLWPASYQKEIRKENSYIKFLCAIGIKHESSVAIVSSEQDAKYFENVITWEKMKPLNLEIDMVTAKSGDFDLLKEYILE